MERKKRRLDACEGLYEEIPMTVRPNAVFGQPQGTNPVRPTAVSRPIPLPVNMRRHNGLPSAGTTPNVAYRTTRGTIIVRPAARPATGQQRYRIAAPSTPMASMSYKSIIVLLLCLYSIFLHCGKLMTRLSSYQIRCAHLEMKVECLEKQLSAIRSQREKLAVECDMMRRKLMSLAGKSNKGRVNREQITYGMSRSDEKIRKRERVIDSIRPLVTLGNGTICLSSLRSLISDLFCFLSGGSSFFPKLSVIQDIKLIKLLDLSWERRRELHRYLRSLGISILPALNRTFSFYSEGVLSVFQQYRSFNVGSIGVVCVKDVRARVQRIVNELGDACDLSGHWKGQIHLGVAIDGGAGSVKLMVNCLNSGKGNSPRSMVLLGAFIGQEDYDTIKASLGMVLHDLCQIESLFHSGSSYPVCISIVADRKMVNILYGCMNCSARYPCVECLWRKGTFVGSECELRDVDEMFEVASYYLRHLADTEDDDTESVFCSTKLPLITIPLVNVWPPTLHQAIGLGGRLMTSLLVECINNDLRSINSTVVLSGYEKEKREEAKQTVIDQLKHLSSWVLESRREIRDLQLFIDMRSNDSESGDDCCASPVCASGRVLPEWNQWMEIVVCSACSRDFHAYCTGICLHDADLDSLRVPDTFTCERCYLMAESDRLEHWQARMCEMKGELDVSNKKLAENRSKLDETIAFIDGKGTSHTTLNRIWKTLKIYRSGGFQPYNGRMAKQAMMLIDHVLDKLDFAPSEAIVGCMRALGQLMRYTQPRFLTDFEVEHIKCLVVEIQYYYETVIPTASEQVLYHSLFAHLPQFVERWRTLGLFSEQGLESSHKWLSRLLVRYSNISDQRDRLHRVTAEHEYLSSILRRDSRVGLPRRMFSEEEFVGTETVEEESMISNESDEALFGDPTIIIEDENEEDEDPEQLEISTAVGSPMHITRGTLRRSDLPPPRTPPGTPPGMSPPCSTTGYMDYTPEKILPPVTPEGSPSPSPRRIDRRRVNKRNIKYVEEDESTDYYEYTDESE